MGGGKKEKTYGGCDAIAVLGASREICARVIRACKIILIYFLHVNQHRSFDWPDNDMKTFDASFIQASCPARLVGD